MNMEETAFDSAARLNPPPVAKDLAMILAQQQGRELSGVDLNRVAELLNAHYKGDVTAMGAEVMRLMSEQTGSASKREPIR